MKRIMTLSIASLAFLTLLFSTGCKKTSNDPGENYVDHMQAVFRLMKDNKHNCDKMLNEVTSYMGKNKTEIQNAIKKIKDMDAKLSEAEKTKHDEKMKKISEDVAKQYMYVMLEVSRKCPKQMQKISEIMDSIDKIN